MTDTSNTIAELAAAPFEARNETSIWQQISDRIEAACLDGRLLGRLPGENHMAEAFGVTRVTMRRALTRLQHEGLLQARKGVGIFVRPSPLKYRVDHGRRFADGLQSDARIETITTSVLHGTATAEEAEALGIGPGASVLRLSRVRIVDGAPVYYSEKTFPAQLFPGFEASYAPRQSVRDAYVAHGIEDYRRAETRVSGGFATPAEAGALRLTPQTPVLRSVAINAAPDGTLIEFNRGTWPLTAVELVMKNTTKGQ